jgi:hypothetical protein
MEVTQTYFESLFLIPYINAIFAVGNHFVYPLMIGTFMFGLCLRGLIYYTVARHEWFAYEFEKRVNRFLESEDVTKTQSFYVMLKRQLEKTFYEIFETRDRLKRRKPDSVQSMADRVFLIRQGSAWIVRDTMKQARYLKFGETPHFVNVTKTVFHKNPCFNRVLGVVSAASLNDVLSLLPSLFVIVGIFGTFIGVMSGLQELNGIDPQDAEKTKMVMDGFVTNIAYSMGASVMGIMCSVLFNLANTIWSPEKAFVSCVDRFENSLILLWNRANNNEVPRDGQSFDEHRDAVEALAEAALNQELAKRKGDREHDSHAPKQAS